MSAPDFERERTAVGLPGDSQAASQPTSEAPEWSVRIVDEGPGVALSDPDVEFLGALGEIVTLGIGEEAPWASAEQAPEATTASKGWHLGEPRWDQADSVWIVPAQPDHTFSLFVRDSVTNEFVTGLEGEFWSFDYGGENTRNIPIRVDRPGPLVFHGFHFGRGMVGFFLNGPNYLLSVNSRIPIGPGANEFTDRVHSLEFGATRLTVQVVEADSGVSIPDVRVTVLRDERDEINHVDLDWDVRPTDNALKGIDWRVEAGTQDTDADGRIELPVEAPGRYRVAIHGEAQADLLSDSFYVPLGSPHLQRFELPRPATLFGQITVDPATADNLDLLALQSIGLRGEAFDYSLNLYEGESPLVQAGTPANFDRSYSLEGLAPGTYRYLLTGKPDSTKGQLFELRLDTGEVTLQAGETQRLDIHVDGQPGGGGIPAGVTVRGTWTPDFGGRARPEAVMLLALEAGEAGNLRSPITRAVAGATGVDEQGRFELDGIPSGRYLLLGQGELEAVGSAQLESTDRLMATMELEVGDQDLDVSLHSGPRAVRFVHLGSEPSSGGRLSVRLGAPEGPPWLDTLLRNGEFTVRTDGEFTLHGLPSVPLLCVVDGVETPLESGQEVTVELK